MNVQQVVATEQLTYATEIAQVNDVLKKLGMRPDSDVRVYPLELGWYATVLVRFCVLVFRWHSDRLTFEIQPYSGSYPNGALVLERNINDVGQ